MDPRISRQVDQGQLKKGLDLIGQLMRLSLIKADETKGPLPGQAKLPGTSQEPFTFKQPGGVRLTTRPSSPTRPVASGPQLKLPGHEPHQSNLPQTEKITPKVLPEPHAPEKREHEAGPLLIGGGQSKQADWGGLEAAAKRAQAAGPAFKQESGSKIFTPEGRIVDPSGKTPSRQRLGQETMMAAPRSATPKIVVPGAEKPSAEIITPGPQSKPGAEIIKPAPTVEPSIGTEGRRKEMIGEGLEAVSSKPGEERTAAMKRTAALLGSRGRERAAEAPVSTEASRLTTPQSYWMPGKPGKDQPAEAKVLGKPEGEGDLTTGEGGKEPSGKKGGKEPSGLPPSGWDPFKKLSRRSKRRGPNLIGGYGFGHAMGATAASPGGGAAQLGMLTGRAVSTVHGLLNRQGSRYGSRYEMARLGREGELTRRAQLGRMQGEAGGVMTQGSMVRSLFIRVDDGGNELVKSRIKPKKPKSRLFVSLYSNSALFGRGKKDKEKEPTVQLPTLMPKTSKPRTVTLFGKAKDEFIPDPQNEDIQPDEEDGVASVLVGDSDLVSKAARGPRPRRRTRRLILHHEKKMVEHQNLMVTSPTAEGANLHAKAMGLHLQARGRHMRGDARAEKTSIEANVASESAHSGINKAGAAQESTGRWTLEDPVQAKREQEHGLYRQPTGVSGGPTPDLPERGKDWHGTVPGVPDEPQDDDEEEIEETWAAPKPILESEKKKTSEVSKALASYCRTQQRARDVLKSLPDLHIGPDLSPRELEFLKSQGVDDDAIIRGNLRITPRMRVEFRQFMTDRVFKSLSGLRNQT